MHVSILIIIFDLDYTLEIMIKRTLVSLLLIITLSTAYGDHIKFALVTDTHIGNATGAADLENTVNDINKSKEIEFVILSGDVTEFGSDEELNIAKTILDKLNKPWYVVPGNHDSNWSESGANTFNTVFGRSTFEFEHKGVVFLGTGSGPNMRMGPGQIPREDIVWLEKALGRAGNRPIVYVNHYPQDSSLNNWYSALDLLKKKNIQFMLCGHGHINKLYNSEGIANVMCRSNLRAKDSIGGYNIITISNGVASFQEKRPLMPLNDAWLTLKLSEYKSDSIVYKRPSYDVNKKQTKVKQVWEYQDDSDLGTGISLYGTYAITANTKGEVYALDIRKGKRIWTFKSNGKIYSTPAVASGIVVVGSSDHFIYGLSAENGKQLWKIKANKAVLGSPVIFQNVAYIGSSDNIFRAIDILNGKLVWEYKDVEGFVVTKPLVYQNKVFFGSWGRYFYALNLKTGKEIWKWNNGSSNRMFSPAACYPVAAYGKVFIAAPDRYFTAFDANTGEVLWRVTNPHNRVRESIGISGDSSTVYAKTMDGKVIGASTRESEYNENWKSSLSLPYEISPTAIVEDSGLIFVPSQSGLVSALDRKSGDVVWQYKTSNSLVNVVLPIGNNKVLVSTMDGKINCLAYNF
ncbi:metallophosphoesterase [Pseudopedobacter saltans DSM 12145]|uniref:Metallophosphoesterase n=1 Tax=Pseudopedobacter saltans (strain ATCC 51119 / DSM 12145 / JCM 21818 / CCUG 39354 / LMG 10337 / NBRC 100064 / NCIMB 13643) TaxID=762903 RepID=F0S8T5_PSESL|nr:PQQ-binding-like beta-propeller repeat protein [Pseudopedobacter saltans]ADY52416.1 metallophosphoesterase [Pseudopedobacter saltans DSM 12145]